MCKRSKKPLGKQQKKKRKNRKVREYEKIKMELTNLSPAERRRERILAEAERENRDKHYSFDDFCNIDDIFVVCSLSK